MEVLDEKATINPTYFTGSGRCVNECPTGAISIEIEYASYIENHIAKIESIVDVEDQNSKVSSEE